MRQVTLAAGRAAGYGSRGKSGERPRVSGPSAGADSLGPLTRGRSPGSAPLLLVLLLALLGPLLGALAVPGVALELEVVHPAGHERPHLAQAGHHLQPLPQRHLRHLLHEHTDLVELLEELVDLVRL